jgi:hypothetical protein
MGMRLIQVQVPESCRDEVLTLLREEGIDVLQTELVGHGDLLVEFPLPTPGVDGVVERLYEAGLPEDGYTVIQNAEGAQTPNTPNSNPGSSRTRPRARASPTRRCGRKPSTWSPAQCRATP